MIADIRGVRPDADFIVASGDPTQTRTRHGVQAEPWADARALMRAAERCDVIVIGGGCLFRDSLPRDTTADVAPAALGIRRCRGFADLATLFDKPLMLYAVGIGPLLTEEGRRCTQEIATLADVITVRDPDSRRLLVSLGIDPGRIEVSGDPASGAGKTPAADVVALAERPRAAAHAQVSSARLEHTERMLRALDEELRAIKATAGWSLLQWLWRLRRSLAPQDSLRARLLERVLRRRDTSRACLAALARAVWPATAGLARRSRGSRWRTLALPPGSRRERLARGVLRRVREAAWTRQPGAHTLAEVLERVRGSHGAVIFLPSIGWRVSLFQRPHQLARAFARRGYVAIFDTSNVLDDVHGFVEVEAGLFLFSGRESQLHQIPSPLLWTFPYNHHQAQEYPSPKIVLYDWIDDLAVFSGHDAGLLRRNHAQALAGADIVTSVARALHARAVGLRPDSIYLPNGVDDEHFAADDAPPPEDPIVARLRADGKPIAGYYGALAEWFDYVLVEETARRRPDWNFLLIGPEYDRSLQRASLLDCPNVVWAGPRPYQTLPGYLRLFDVATIPFQVNAITIATSPLKLYEYFAGGKPVITTPMPECTAHPQVDVVTSPEEFAAALDVARAKGLDPMVREGLRAVAAKNSWTERVRQIETVLSARAAS
jgi:glycosyltransferase involved in cell wall biosynthesis